MARKIGSDSLALFASPSYLRRRGRPKTLADLAHRVDQGLLIDGGNNELAFYIADLAPTSAHLPLAWIMGYDVEPLVTLETKRRILKRAVDESWHVIFEHDAFTAWSQIENDGKTYKLSDFKGKQGVVLAWFPKAFTGG